MRPGRTLVPLLALGLIGGAVLLAQPAARAQDATPVPVAADLSTFSTELVGILPGITLPASADMVVTRALFAPGVVVPFAASPDSGAMLVIVESGEVTISVENEDLRISRGGALQQAMASPSPDGDLFGMTEVVTGGEPATLQVNDLTLLPPTANGEMRNVSMEPATALLILMGPAMADAGAAAATPAP
ncbi:MAG: hypothetical protein QM692_03165 [Thermomicrobiales bacterium]